MARKSEIRQFYLFEALGKNSQVPFRGLDRRVAQGLHPPGSGLRLRRRLAEPPIGY